jgi:hypothetical protein
LSRRRREFSSWQGVKEQALFALSGCHSSKNQPAGATSFYTKAKLLKTIEKSYTKRVKKSGIVVALTLFKG